uniref:MULE transposase domain-containing protein n=1 Tax=Noccaea caerulescens TaxID=107243 RepID=A0A1J3JQN4_NOCCA
MVVSSLTASTSVLNNCCRKVIGLDGCFLKWDLNGDLLSAVGRDADNNRMYPIAWAVVRGENKDTWGWFIQKLKENLDLGNGDNFTVISDKQKGLVIAVQAELPNAEHRMCGRHIYANWKKQGFSRYSM